MNKFLYFTFLFIILSVRLLAYPKVKGVYFFGHIQSDQDSIKLSVAFSQNYLTGGRFEDEILTVPVDKNGDFHFSFPSIYHSARMYVYDIVSGNVLFTKEEQIVEPGDSIDIMGVIRNDADSSYFKAHFSGRGAARFECVEELKKVSEQNIMRANDFDRCISIRDSILNLKMGILNKFRMRLGRATYKVMIGDIVGEVNTLVLYSACGYGVHGIFRNEMPDSSRHKIALPFQHFIQEKDLELDPDLIWSSEYIKYLYEEEKCKLAFIYGGKRFEVKDLYNFVKMHFSGTIRERIIAYCLLNQSEMAVFWNGSNADDYTYCIKDALSIVRADWIKKSLEHLLATEGKGSVPFDFILDKDSSTNKIKLSDYIGKVVLLDMWGYNCTGCYMFANSFHQSVFPVFKDNPDFKVISIMVDGLADRTHYMGRLRRERQTTYTFPSYINLFAGKGVEGGREIEQHYQIDAWPCLILVGKDGRIYSSTIPYFTSATSPNVRRLIALIDQALKEP